MKREARWRTSTSRPSGSERATAADDGGGGVLWSALRRNQLAGLHFRRQHAVGRFILDFYCASRKLCVEVDGAIHDEQCDRDQARTDALAYQGIRVIRFRNEEVLSDLASVVNRIRTAALEKGESE